jgi:SAM-dependent methyltransferase
MSNTKTFHQVWRKHGIVTAIIKSLARLIGKRVLIDGVDIDYPEKLNQRDLSLPTNDDSAATHQGYSRWNHVLPLPTDRMMLHVGAETVENFLVVADAWAQVLSRFILPGSHVMDVGCGCGRTARLLAINPNVQQFTGFDVVKPYIDWCNSFFSETYPGRFVFHHLDVQTERYNPKGQLSCQTARFPAADGDIDFIYAASVFTHLYPEDLGSYAAEMNRVLKSDGLALVSIHDQPKSGELFSGSEHRADYEAGHFLSLMQGAGFALLEDIGDLCGQRTFVLHKT